MQDYPVAIVGGGPVGLSASIQLSRLGIRHILFERHETPSLHPKSRAINVRSMEIFRRWGIEQAVRDASMGRPPVRFFGRDVVSPWDHVMDAANQFGEVDDGRYSPISLLVVLCSQDALEPILRREGLAHGAATHRFSCEVEDWSQDADGVTLRVRDRKTGARETVRAGYMIGADGARSAIRDRLGIACFGEDSVQEAVSVLFRSNLLPERIGITSAFVNIHNPDTVGSVVIAPVDGTGRAALLGRPKIMNERPSDRIDWMEQLKLAVGDPNQEFDLIDVRTWLVEICIAERYHEGRVFLAGDAAHTMPPHGGFNMNTGIQDIHNLGWKLAAVLKGWARPDLLASYTAERRGVAEVNAAEGLLNFRTHIGRDAQGRPLLYRREHFVHPGLSLGFRYNAGALLLDPGQAPLQPWPIGSYDPDAAPGARAPHAPLMHGDERISTLDLFDADMVLLAPAGSAGADAIEAAAARAGVPLIRHDIGGACPLQDPSERWRTLYGIAPDGAVIIRPDGHVAFRARDAADAARADDAISALTGRSGAAVPPFPPIFATLPMAEQRALA